MRALARVPAPGAPARESSIHGDGPAIDPRYRAAQKSSRNIL
jgi:hypothetical protein